ncbi:hypothetical protein BA011_01835 [Rhizobium leguminosarum]|uniref:Uncharacterized protein n=1 Tax=Rhizobium leguminosarum TaxID=384 RepID=A0A1B1C4E7_RHILE|nr:hypothetical protein BA011_01835 [Rhizobium leguminosarum]
MYAVHHDGQLTTVAAPMAASASVAASIAFLSPKACGLDRRPDRLPGDKACIDDVRDLCGRCSRDADLGDEQRIILVDRCGRFQIGASLICLLRIGQSLAGAGRDVFQALGLGRRVDRRLSAAFNASRLTSRLAHPLVRLRRS